MRAYFTNGRAIVVICLDLSRRHLPLLNLELESCRGAAKARGSKSEESMAVGNSYVFEVAGSG